VKTATAEVLTPAANDSETASVALARIVEPLGPSRAATLRESFGSMFDKVDSWREEAALLQVTKEDQTGKMTRARALRLEIKAGRVALDKRRKDLTAEALLEQRAVNGAMAIFVALSEPLEKWLLEQEQFAARAEATRKDALRDARQAALSAHGVSPQAMPAALGDLSEEAWAVVLADAQAAQQARLDAMKREEEIRIEAARIQAENEAKRRAEAVRLDAERVAREAEQRAENDRLKAEAAKREEEMAAERVRADAELRASLDKAAAERAASEKELKAERDAAETKARAERKAAEEARAEAEAARVAAETEAATLRRAEEDRRAREAEAKKPTKAKYIALCAAMRRIAALGGEAGTIAASTLVEIGEEVVA